MAAFTTVLTGGGAVDGPPDGPRIEYLPVTMTRWPPEERKY